MELRLNKAPVQSEEYFYIKSVFRYTRKIRITLLRIKLNGPWGGLSLLEKTETKLYGRAKQNSKKLLNWPCTLAGKKNMREKTQQRGVLKRDIIFYNI